MSLTKEENETYINQLIQPPIVNNTKFTLNLLFFICPKFS